MSAEEKTYLELSEDDGSHKFYEATVAGKKLTIRFGRIGASGLLSAKLAKNSKLKVYPGAPHGMCTTLADQVNADLLAFLKS